MGVQKDLIELKISSNTKIKITKSAVGVILRRHRQARRRIRPERRRPRPAPARESLARVKVP